MKKVSVRIGHVLTALTVLASVNAQAVDTYYPAWNLLAIDAISVDEVKYKNVTLTLNSVTLLGVDNGLAVPDTFKSSNRLLTLGSLLFQGVLYNNVRVELNSVTVLSATLVVDTPDASTPSAPGAPTTPTVPTTPPASPSGTLTAANTCSLSNFQTDLMTLINQARASSKVCGGTAYPAVPALAWNSKLFDASAAHSADMANNNYFSHTSLDGRTFDQRISAAGYGWSRLGENIAAGQSSAASVMAGWMASPGHCSNIMGANFTEVGVACVVNNSSTYHTYWTMDLGKP